MLCGDRYLAEDLVQEVLARVHGRWRRQRIEHLDAYLKAAVVRQFLSWRRRRSGNEPLLEPGREAPAAGRADSADAHAERDAVWTELAGLPRQQRAVLVLRYYEDPARRADRHADRLRAGDGAGARRPMADRPT
jgi:RNA polymerase sigma factor (sigma-70 family)